MFAMTALACARSGDAPRRTRQANAAPRPGRDADPAPSLAAIVYDILTSWQGKPGEGM